MAEESIISAQAAASTDFTVGVEEEYQLVDLETGALRDHASVLLGDDWTGELLAELQESTVETGTPICGSVAEVATHLQRLRFQAGTVAAAHGLAIAASGIHPFSAWEGHERPPLERYRAIEARYGRIAKDEHIYGMHVHVAVPEGICRLSIMNVVRHYLPHLLALSASSPFFEGADTGFASFRTILWRRWPNSGIPPRFASVAEFEQCVDALLQSGTMADRGNLYWSMRPHATYPTVEFRVMDVCPSLRDAAAIAALARALVHAAATGVLRDEALLHFSAPVEQELIRSNEWRAARDGLAARVVDTRDGRGHQPMRAAILELLDTVSRCADDLGDSAAMAQLAQIVERDTGAMRMRERHAESGSLRDLVAWVVHETQAGTGLDRREKPREAVG